MDAALDQELKKRRALSDLVVSYIHVHFEFDPKKRFKRGMLQKEIAHFIGLTVNTTFCQIVNNCMKNLGHELIEVRGQYYYKNLKRIQE